jgi:hypothetical protein
MYRRRITWILRVATVAGLGLSFAAVPGYWAFGASLLLLMLEQFLERSVFIYSSIHVQPMPTFEYEPAKWESVAYIQLKRDGRLFGHALGLVFTDLAYARQFFELLRAWNLGESADRDNNIRISFIRDQDSHFLWLYPSPERAPVRRSMRRLAREAYYRREDAEPMLITMFPYFCKDFRDKGALTAFLSAVNPGNRFQIMAMVSTGEGAVEEIRGVEPIWKYHHKTCAKRDLTDGDFEYVIWKRKGLL